MSQPSNYTFGDNPRAARRLELLAEVFSRPTVAFVREHGGTPLSCVDLGCGSGRTTRLLYEALGPRWIVGLERSPALLLQAETEMAGAGITFQEQDVEQPLGLTAELVFARFLLTHLSHPQEALRVWLDAVVPGGRLLVQEVSGLESSDSRFSQYYATVAQLQRHHGQSLNIGRQLADLAGQCSLEVGYFGQRVVERPAAAMAELHAMNLPTWSKDPFIQEHFDSSTLAELLEYLTAVGRGEVSAPPVKVTLGELVL